MKKRKSKFRKIWIFHLNWLYHTIIPNILFIAFLSLKRRRNISVNKDIGYGIHVHEFARSQHPPNNRKGGFFNRWELRKRNITFMCEQPQSIRVLFQWVGSNIYWFALDAQLSLVAKLNKNSQIVWLKRLQKTTILFSYFICS